MWTDLFTIAGMVAVTWGVRAAPFVFANMTLSPNMLRFLNCVPPAVLAALVAETILLPVSESGSVLEPEVLAAILCLITGLLRAPLLLTVIVGMLSYWLLGYFL